MFLRALRVGRMKRLITVLVAVPVLCLALTSCVATEATSVEDLSGATALAGRLDVTLRGEGRTPYGGLSGLGGATREGTVQLAGDRGRTSIYAMCDGPAGEARISIDGSPSVVLLCDDEPQVVVLQDEFSGVGVRMSLRVEDAPAGSVWAVTAGASSSS